MAIRKYKPTTPGRRGASVADFAEITRDHPEKSPVRPLHDKGGVPATVAHIEYDPNRTARIALLHYADGEKRYILAPRLLKQGDRIENGPSADIKPGNALPL